MKMGGLGYLRTIIIIMCSAVGLRAQAEELLFDRYFDDATLRIDYTFAGDAARQQIYVDALSESPRWYGRRVRLDSVPLQGNGQITMRALDGTIIYRHSFSTLFQEWLATDEAKRISRSFENVFLMPYPKDTVDVTVQLFDFHCRQVASLTHRVVPSDILIRHRRAGEHEPYVTLQRAADTTRCINIAFVAEGYTAQELTSYLTHCRQAMTALFNHEPFKSRRSRFNIVAVLSTSESSGVSEPAEGIWRDTALGSHFDTFYSKRYLTTLNLKRLHNMVAGIPYEHLIILANTEHYGGGGIYNSYVLSYTRGEQFLPVVVHEFGHSFGGLGDEYPYGNDDPMYFSDTEPWEPNLTTLHNFADKWQDLVDRGKASLIEGGGYQEKGVYRGAADCRMRTNSEPEFCAVCRRWLNRLIDFYTE